MQFSTAQAEVAAQLGLDETQSDTATLLKRWLNLSQAQIAAAYNWSWLQDRESVVTELDLTTGTISATAASATITFSAAPTASQANRFIQMSSADDWYEITAHTGGADTATISPVYAQTTNLTGGTFVVRTFFYSLSSTTDLVYNVKKAVSQQYIPLISADRYDKFAPFPDATGEPERIVMWKRDSSRNLQFTPFPWPDSILLLEFRVYKKPSDLANATDTPLFREKFDSLWLMGAEAQGYKFLDDTREISTRSQFLKGIEDMKERDNPAIDKSRFLSSIDEGVRNRNIIQFPSEFGDTHDF